MSFWRDGEYSLQKVNLCLFWWVLTFRSDPHYGSAKQTRDWDRRTGGDPEMQRHTS